jgi:DNA-binding response OmpR family regulator
MGVGEGKTVLVVDDDPSLRLLCRVNLELDGYRVVEAASTAEVRAALASGPVDAMVLDLHLGGEDGRDLLAALGDEAPPVAIFTGSEMVTPELLAAAEVVLAKPFAFEDLRKAVDRLVGLPARVDSTQ